MSVLSREQTDIFVNTIQSYMLPENYEGETLIVSFPLNVLPKSLAENLFHYFLDGYDYDDIKEYSIERSNITLLFHFRDIDNENIFTRPKERPAYEEIYKHIFINNFVDFSNLNDLEPFTSDNSLFNGILNDEDAFKLENAAFDVYYYNYDCDKTTNQDISYEEEEL